MSKRKLDVGTVVRFVRVRTTMSTGASEYRVEQLLRLECGDTLYKIKSNAEPFDRIVSEHDLATQR